MLQPTDGFERHANPIGARRRLVGHRQGLALFKVQVEAEVTAIEFRDLHESMFFPEGFKDVSPRVGTGVGEPRSLTGFQTEVYQDRPAASMPDRRL